MAPLQCILQHFQNKPTNTNLSPLYENLPPEIPAGGCFFLLICPSVSMGTVLIDTLLILFVVKKNRPL